MFVDDHNNLYPPGLFYNIIFTFIIKFVKYFIKFIFFSHF